MSYAAPPPHANGPPPHPPSPYAYGYAYGWTPPPGPAPGLRYAGFWIRFLAFLIDWLITSIPIGAVAAALIAPALGTIHCTITTTGAVQSINCSGLEGMTMAIYILSLLSLVVPGVYFVVFWSWLGQTLGQKLIGLHVVEANTGRRISVARAIGRYAGYVLSSWVLDIGLIWAAFDHRKQGWHDKLASTFVVRRA